MQVNTALTATLVLLGHATAGYAQERGGQSEASPEEPANVLYTASALPWTGPPGGVRTAPLFGTPQAEGEAFTFRLQLPDGFEMAAHTHPVAEHMTVLSGRFYVGIGEVLDREKGTAYGPGSYVVVAAGVPAYMWAEGPTVVQVHGIGPLTTDFLSPPAPGGP